MGPTMSTTRLKVDVRISHIHASVAKIFELLIENTIDLLDLVLAEIGGNIQSLGFDALLRMRQCDRLSHAQRLHKPAILGADILESEHFRSNAVIGVDIEIAIVDFL